MFSCRSCLIFDLFDYSNNSKTSLCAQILGAVFLYNINITRNIFTFIEYTFIFALFKKKINSGSYFVCNTIIIIKLMFN